VRLGLANGQNTAPNLTPEQLRSDVREMGRLCDVIGWSEFGENADHRILRDELAHWQHVGTTECPVSVRRGAFRILDAETVWVLERGRAGVNPRRPAQVAVIESVKRPRLEPFAVVATHWTNGAFSNPGQRAEEWRDDAWLDCWEGTRDVVRELLDDGIPTLLVGDLNARRVPRFVRRQEWLPGSSGIDKGAAFEPLGSSTRFGRVEHVKRVELHSKHDGRVWRVPLRRG
jgi:hypothetical protein